MHIAIRRESEARDLPLPAYATAGAAGLDLYAALEADLTLETGARALISTGIRLQIPEGYEAQVRPRSGLALRHGLTLVNSPGTIDSDYRGIVQVIVINLGQERVVLRRGDRIAQLVVAPIIHVEWEESDDTDDAMEEARAVRPRGERGFGSTGR